MITSLTILAAILFAVLWPEVSAAAVPFVPCSGLDCSACHFAQMGNTILKWLIGLLFVLFAVIAAVAGFGLVTSGGNEQARNDAKSKLTNAVIGIIIVLAAWLLVDTIMRALLPGKTGEITGYGPWSEVKCQVQQTPETKVEALGSVAVSGTYGTGGSSLTENDAKNQLAAAGIGDGGNVISYDGLKQHTVDQVIGMNIECGCDIVVTEATGGTHAAGTYSHENGYKLDLRTKDNPELVQYVKDNFSQEGTTSAGELIYQRPDNEGGYQKCIFHSTHLDCQFVPGG